MNRECRKCLSGVDSTNSNRATSTGFSHRQFFIFAAVSPSPQRPLRASGRFANGHSTISSPRNRRMRDSRTPGVKPLRVRPAQHHRARKHRRVPEGLGDDAFKYKGQRELFESRRSATSW